MDHLKQLKLLFTLNLYKETDMEPKQIPLAYQNSDERGLAAFVIGLVLITIVTLIIYAQV